jgi:RNA polymerase sigma-70 factor (ECF subfamily)
MVTLTVVPEPALEPMDAALIDRVRRGDSAAFDSLVRLHMRAAFALAYRIVGQREDAEDLVQDSFIAALDHLDSFDTSRAFGPWFHRIVVNRAISARRRDARHPTQQFADDQPAGSAPPSAAVEQREMQERVRAALEKLPERQRTIMQLASFDGLNSTEIGALLELPPGTVRWELHEARRALRDQLAACRGNDNERS